MTTQPCTTNGGPTFGQNSPNPFNPTTTTDDVVGLRSSVTLMVYDVLGREVATLLNEEKSLGTYALPWDASGFVSGVYFYRLTAGSYVVIKEGQEWLKEEDVCHNCVKIKHSNDTP
jgi:hypothetical protein